MNKSLKKGLQLYASRRFLLRQSNLFNLVWPAILVLQTAQAQISLQGGMNEILKVVLCSYTLRDIISNM